MPVLADLAAAAALRTAFARADFTEAAVCNLLGLAELPTDRRLAQSLPVYLWRTRAPTPLTTLTRVFLLGQPVAAADAAAALPNCDAGVLQRSGDAVRSAVQIV